MPASGPALTLLGVALTITSEEAVPVQPLAAVPVTVYEVFETGLTVMDALVAPPGFQTYEAAPEAVMVTSVPRQTSTSAGLTVITGEGLTVTIT
ncbi:hypothetical protein SDC9_26537 [bioreactor metagenome]|uniref:Uncharacterized protein n=1 Tax=bioreactor metagenome TaxID=1076179 RepID=A0A644UNJ6_9ZZZZ